MIAALTETGQEQTVNSRMDRVAAFNAREEAVACGPVAVADANRWRQRMRAGGGDEYEQVAKLMRILSSDRREFFESRG